MQEAVSGWGDLLRQKDITMEMRVVVRDRGGSFGALDSLD